MTVYQKWFLVASGKWEYRYDGALRGLVERTDKGYAWAAAGKRGVEPRYDDAQCRVRNAIALEVSAARWAAIDTVSA